MIDGATAVVAGIDGSPNIRAAADVAAWEADRRGLCLRLVHGDELLSGDQPVLPSDITEQRVPPTRVTQSGYPVQMMLEEIGASIRARHPRLPVECAVIAGNASAVLVEESKTASMLVLCSRGMGRFRSLLIGSVSEQVATHANGPVLVTRRDVAAPRQRLRMDPLRSWSGWMARRRRPGRSGSRAMRPLSAARPWSLFMSSTRPATPVARPIRFSAMP